MNTKFFHLSTVIRRRRNKIDRLKVSNTWIDDLDVLTNHIVNYFNEIFEYHSMTDVDWSHTPLMGRLTSIDNCRLDYVLSDWEIKNAVDSMGAWKAPGPDGLQPAFYQSCWNTVGPTVCAFIKKLFY